MINCPRCGREVAAGMKHVPSVRRDGSEYEGRRRCIWLALDDAGRTWRERAPVV